MAFWWVITILIVSLSVLGHIYGVISQNSMISKLQEAANNYQPPRTGQKLLWEDKRVLVFVNPISGIRLGRMIFQSILKPMLEKANIQFHMIETKSRGHAQEYIKNLNETVLSQYSGIVVIGGDGTVFEVLNGLLERIQLYEKIQEPAQGDYQTVISSPWFQRAQQILARYPIGVVPGGTSNAIADKMSSSNVVEAVKKLIEGRPNKLALFRVEFPETQQKPVWDCLVVCWGAIPDFDYYQEVKFRSLGWLRNVLAPLIVISQGKSYQGNVKIVPAPLTEEQQKNKRYKNTSLLPSEAAGEWRTLNDTNFTMVFAANIAVGPVAERSTRVMAHEGAFDLIVVSKCTRKEVLTDIFLGLESGEYMNHPSVSLYKARELYLEPTNTGKFSVSGQLINETPMKLTTYPELLSLVY